MLWLWSILPAVLFVALVLRRLKQDIAQERDFRSKLSGSSPSAHRPHLAQSRAILLS
jgi:hypothetical protein